MFLTDRIKKEISTPKNLKKGAKAALIILSLSILRQLVFVYEIKYALTSPLVPESAIWEICKEYIFKASFLTVSCIAAIILYFYDKYVSIIILTVLALVVIRLIYLT